MKTKACKKCGVLFDGVRCKPCSRASNAAYRAANPEKARAASAAWMAANPERARAASAKWRAANLEKARAAAAAYRAANPAKRRAWNAANPEKACARAAAYRAANVEKVRSAKAARRAANPEKMRSEYAAWRAANPDKSRSASRAWKAANPEARTALQAERRARKRNASPGWRDDFDALVIREAYHLSKLREKATGLKWHVDHEVPLMGKRVCGLHVAANLAVIPATLNVKKGNRFTCGEGV